MKLLALTYFALFVLIVLVVAACVAPTEPDRNKTVVPSSEPYYLPAPPEGMRWLLLAPTGAYVTMHADGSMHVVLLPDGGIVTTEPRCAMRDFFPECPPWRWEVS